MQVYPWLLELVVKLVLFLYTFFLGRRLKLNLPILVGVPFVVEPADAEVSILLSVKLAILFLALTRALVTSLSSRISNKSRAADLAFASEIWLICLA